MLVLDYLNYLFALLQNPDWGARQSSVEVIAALTEFGRLIYRFVLCKD